MSAIAFRTKWNQTLSEWQKPDIKVCFLWSQWMTIWQLFKQVMLQGWTFCFLWSAQDILLLICSFVRCSNCDLLSWIPVLVRKRKYPDCSLLTWRNPVTAMVTGPFHIFRKRLIIVSVNCGGDLRQAGEHERISPYSVGQCQAVSDTVL